MELIQDLLSILVSYYGPFLGQLVEWLSSNAKKITEVAAAIAVVTGAFSAYLRFFYGQTLFYRIDPQINAEAVTTRSGSFIKIRVEAKNIGTVACHLAREQQKAEIPLWRIPFRYIFHVFHSWRRWMKGEKETFIPASWLIVLRSHRQIVEDMPCHIGWDDEKHPWEIIKLFPNQEWIRSGETISDEYLIDLPSSDIFAVRLEARIISKQRLLRPCSDEWHACMILPLAAC